MRAATPLDQPRAIGRAFISSKRRDERSAIDGLRQSGTLRVLFPTRAKLVEAIVINTSGGVTGGDDFRVEAKAGAGSTLMLTTQAAERAYRAQHGQTGQIETVLEADLKGLLLPLDVLIEHMPKIEISDAQATSMLQGKPTTANGLITSELTRFYQPNGYLYGVGEVSESGFIKAQKTFVGTDG